MDRKLPTFLDPSNLAAETVLGGVQGDYVIVRKLGTGKRGNTYLARATKPRPLARCLFDPVLNRQEVVIKTVNLSLQWPLVEVLEYVSRVNRSLQKELYVLAKLKGLKCAAQVHDYNHFHAMLGEEFFVHPMFIVQGFVRGTTLDNYVVEKWGANFSGIPRAQDWFQIASLIATNLIAVHQREVVHRDIWPPNIMIDEARSRGSSMRLSFIDFGDAVLRHELAAREPFGHDHPYKAPERVNNWLWPTRRGDIYAVGGVFYFLATGEDPPPPIRNDDDLKHTMVNNIRNRNPGLLKQNQGIADVIARCLRYDPTNRIRDADDLLHEIDVFRAVGSKRPNGWDRELKGALDKIKEQRSRLARPEDNRVNVFAAMAAQDLQLLAHRLESMTHGVRDISGDHEEIVAGLTRYLSVLGPGDEYLAISIHHFWATENLGINGRFLTMNKLIAESGVKIRRLFLVTRDEWEQRPDNHARPSSPENVASGARFWDVAQAHLDIQRTLPNDKKIDLRYLIVNDDVRAEYLKNDVHKGAWISGSSAVTILPVYDQEGRIRTVRMRQYEGKAETLRRELARLIDRGEILSTMPGR